MAVYNMQGAGEEAAGDGWAKLPAVGSLSTQQLLLGASVLALAVAAAWLLTHRKSRPGI